MRKTKQNKGLRTVAAGILCSVLLLAWFPLSAAAVEYTPLATLKKGLRYPVDTAVSDSGKIYVLDGITKKILIYNGNYYLTGSISSVDNPTAVAASGDTLLVADNTTKQVLVLSSSGAPLGSLQKDGAAATFILPRNIAVAANGEVFVVDQNNNTVEVFGADNNHSYTISGLSKPQDAVVVGTELFIVDQPHQEMTGTDSLGGTHSDSVRLSRIQIFDLVTKAIVTDAARAFPPYGTDTTAGEHVSLKGIAADPHDFIYASDSYLNVVYKYDTNGQFLGALAEPFTTPQGASVSADGRLAVTSSY
ncbi:MAG: NHL repeat-containing protein, partial [Desulfobulbales bacterium]|nr:NHL repeat-containing protein [Desulfobulbales bacterium]